MGASRCANCGSTTATASARREGRLWFCSQSCFLQVESRSARLGGDARASRPARPLRVVGKTIKWTVISVVLVVVALVVILVVGAGFAINDSKNEAHRAARGYADVKYHMTRAQVRGLLGAPGKVEVIGRETCWYYGSVLAGEYEFCFRRGRLFSKDHVVS